MLALRALRRPLTDVRVRALLALLGVLAFVPGSWFIWSFQLDMPTTLVLVAGLGMLIGWLCVLLDRAFAGPLRTLISVIGAFREGDYTVRARHGDVDETAGQLTNEVNELGQVLHAQRLQAIEASALLDDLIRSIDVAVLAFDGDGQLKLMNPAASRLLRVDALGEQTAATLGLSELLSAQTRTRITDTIGGRTGRWQVTHGTFREAGRAQHLLIIADVLQALRDEERAAWQRLIRVIGHEVNNSLAPIKSLADTLQDLVGEMPVDTPSRKEALNALCMIGDRSDSLARFLAQYGQLARLPPPQPRWQPLAPLLARVTALNPQHAITVRSPDELEVCVDEDQLEQALINLVKNAVEAQGALPGNVTITAHIRGADLVISIADEGPGIANPDNLFVPLFTTKPGGSGIGLVLSRKIAEAHGGTLQLENRREVSHGAVATLDLPRAARLAR